TKDAHYFAYKTFMDQGLKPAGSSDAPIVDCSPLLGIYAAMTRESIHQNVWGEHERISLKQAVKMYTSYAAHAAYEEDIKGSIEVNKLADMVVLPEGFMNFSAQEVKDSSIKMTIINGEIMYEH